jgi:DNA replication and repair protein RecF
VTLKNLRIQDFRCLAQVELTLHPERNYLFGPNASGKTSVLEAAHFLSRGRSFRTRRNRTLVRHGCEALAVSGQTATDGIGHRLGARLGSAGLQLRVDGQDTGAAETSRLLPVQVIDPEVHRLIDGGPESRRRYLDWGVFHVEHQYLDHWRKFRRILGQRNAALKAGQGDVSVWTEALAASGGAVNDARQHYVGRLSPPLARLGEALLGRVIEIDYRPGWAAGFSLGEALERSRGRDSQLGSTQVGPHRAELRVQLDGQPVREQASRGQQKLISAALTLAQAELFALDQGTGSLLLVDDPAAELDRTNLERFLEVLWSIPAQLVITGLSETVLKPAAGFPVFHVEQAKINKVV